jgi:uncharacterized protein
MKRLRIFHQADTASWQKPETRKLLADNALMAIVLAETYQITREPRFAEAARKTLSFLNAALKDPAGGFQSGVAFLNGNVPTTDPRILTSWNGLAIAATAKAGRILDDKVSIAASRSSAEFLKSQLWSDQRLSHSWLKGVVLPSHYLEDYAYLIYGLIELHEATFEVKWLLWARELQIRQDQYFKDKETQRYFDGSESLAIANLRTQNLFDAKLPSANSVSAHNLMRLGLYFADNSLTEAATLMIQGIAEHLGRKPQWHAFLLQSVDWRFSRPKEVIIVPGGEGPFALDTISRLHNMSFNPYKVILLDRPGAAKDFPVLGGKVAIDGKSTVYVCENQICKFPTTDIDKAHELISDIYRMQLGK